MKRPSNKVIGRIVLAFCAVVLVLLLRACLSPPQAPRPVTRQITYGDVEQTIMATGALEPIELVSVGAQASGQITRLHVTLGQSVRKGALIAEIDARTQQNALRTAQAAVANIEAQTRQAEASLLQADLAFRRQEELLGADATARADYEAARAALASARAQVDALNAQGTQARVSVTTAEVNLGYTRIYAPIDGTVVAIVAKAGQTVNALQAAPTIVKLGRLDTMTVKAKISEADVVNVREGQPVYFTILGQPDRRISARLRSIEPAPESVAEDTSQTSSGSDSEAIYYNGLFDTPNPDGRLRTSMTAQVYIVLGKVSHVLVAPSAALGGSAGANRTLQVVDARGRSQARRVVVGLDNGAVAQIVSGVALGEAVVVSQAAGSDTPAKSTRSGPPSPFGG